MKYFIDTEFLEGSQRKRILGIPTLGLKWDSDNHLEIYKPMTKPTIDLISIGIVGEDGSEYYAISKDFNLKEAWNRHQKIPMTCLGGIGDTPTFRKEYWIRNNVLRPIYEDLLNRSMDDFDFMASNFMAFNSGFNYRHLKALIRWYGKSNQEIANDIKDFIFEDSNVLISKEGYELGSILYYTVEDDHVKKWKEDNPGYKEILKKPTQFYAYFADYDWVAFCWLFGRMIDLPKGFPMYCIDLKQISDEIYIKRKELYYREKKGQGGCFINKMSDHGDYPRQHNEHNALADARWNYELYKFLKEVEV